MAFAGIGFGIEVRVASGRLTREIQGKKGARVSIWIRNSETEVPRPYAIGSFGKWAECSRAAARTIYTLSEVSLILLESDRCERYLSCSLSPFNLRKNVTTFTNVVKHCDSKHHHTQRESHLLMKSS